MTVLKKEKRLSNPCHHFPYLTILTTKQQVLGMPLDCQGQLHSSTFNTSFTQNQWKLRTVSLFFYFLVVVLGYIGDTLGTCLYRFLILLSLLSTQISSFTRGNIPEQDTRNRSCVPTGVAYIFWVDDCLQYVNVVTHAVSILSVSGMVALTKHRASSKKHKGMTAKVSNSLYILYKWTL